MPDTELQIIGLQKQVISEDSGAAVHFHVLVQYSVNLQAEGFSAATYASYVSRDAFDQGKRPLMHVTAQIPAAPVGDSRLFPTWFALQVIDSKATHDLTGAEPVYADEVAE